MCSITLDPTVHDALISTRKRLKSEITELGSRSVHNLVNPMSTCTCMHMSDSSNERFYFGFDLCFIFILELTEKSG